MSDSEFVDVRFELSSSQAEALAQLAKRFGFDDARRLSVDEAEVEKMIGAVLALQRGLGAVGYSPH